MTSLFARPQTWIVIGRNSVPVIGVHAFEWSSGVAVLDFWFDGVSMLAALCLTVVPGVLKDTSSPFGTGLSGRMAGAVLVFLLGFGTLGLPFWFGLLFIRPALGPEIGPELWHPSVALGFIMIAAGNAWEALSRGYGSMPDAARTKGLQWEFQLLLARIAMMMLAAFVLRFGIVAVLATMLTVLELYPLKTLRVLGAPVGEDDVPKEAR